MTRLSLLIAVIGVSMISAQPPVTPLPARTVKPRQGLIRVGTELSYTNDFTHPSGSAALVFDDQFAYLASPGGLYRTALPLTRQSTFDLIGFQNKNIFNLYVHGGALYVLKESVANQGTTATDHAFLRSDDHGATFVPLDNPLQECLGGFCEYLAATEAMFVDGSILINAGGANLLVTNDGGASWTPLIGSLHRTTCSPQPFELIVSRVVVGGDCLDTPYLQSGLVRPDLLEWAQSPTDVATPELQNRTVLTIKNKPNSAEVYASISGALLKSTDDGQHFRYVTSYPFAAAKYPFISDILFPSHAPGVVVVAGRDPLHPFLAYSKDNGETWLDISDKIQSLVADPGAGSPMSSIDFLTEDAQGNIFAGVVHGPTKTLKILELQFNYAMFR